MKKVIIVGAGIAGLTAGVYALQSGFDVTIYESHTIPGGASTSWRRKGYLFEGGMHWLTGSSPKNMFNKIWREVGALNDSVNIYNRDPYLTFEYKGQNVNLYRNLEKLRSHFLDIAPEDEKEINKLCKDIEKFTKVAMPFSDVKGVKVKNKSKFSFLSLLHMVPALTRVGHYTKLSSMDYSKKFKTPLLKAFIEYSMGDENNAMALLFCLATFVSGDGGYPEGGSLAMAGRMADYFKELGGNIYFGKMVSQVIVDEGVAKGIIIEGEKIYGDAVIVTSDTLVAIDTLFDPPINEPWTQKMRQTVPILNTFISLGIEADLKDLPEAISFYLETPFVCGGMPNSLMSINNYAEYKGYAPEGCTALTSIINGDTYDFWKACKENGTYEQEKEKLAESFIKVLEEKFPQIAGKVAFWDVATPLTYERYLHSYKGSWMSGMGKGSKLLSGYHPKPAGINNLYFAGQRMTIPGGLPIAAETARKAVQYLCKDTDTVFQGNM